MPNSAVLADATIWIRYFRDMKAPSNDRFEKLLTAGQIKICGMVLAEVLQGAKTENELFLIQSLMKAVPYLQDSIEDWQQAALWVYQLRKKGITLTLSDCLIAAIAERNDCRIYSLDKDFQRIPHVRLYH